MTNFSFLILLSLVVCICAQDFVCPDNGNFANPSATDCDTFYSCQDNGDGTYTVSLEYCFYPMIWDDTLKICIKRGPDSCLPIVDPCENGDGYQPSDKECSHFYICNSDVATLVSCPAGLVFNSETNSCAFPPITCSDWCTDHPTGAYTYWNYAAGVTCTGDADGTTLPVPWDGSERVAAFCYSGYPILVFCCGIGRHVYGSPGICQ